MSSQPLINKYTTTFNSNIVPTQQEREQALLIGCTTYHFNYWDLIIPSIDILSYVCNSSDKTNLFLTSLFRTFLAVILLNYYLIYFKKYKYSEYGTGILVAYLIINIILTIYIMFKQQKNPKPINAVTAVTT